MFEDLEEDLGDLGPLVKAELVAGINAERYFAQQAAERIEEANARLGAATVDGLGQHVMSIDLTTYHYWNQQYPGCWQDKNFRREVMRDNPATRVRYEPRTASVRIDGFRQPEAVAA